VIVRPLENCVIVRPLENCVIVRPLENCVIVRPLENCVIVRPLLWKGVWGREVPPQGYGDTPPKAAVCLHWRHFV
jgi:hypothetical protein